MKIQWLLFVSLLSLPSLAFSQGLLSPPAAPAPGLKTLQQIEPRIDVLQLPGSASSLHDISQPGAYFLSGPILGQPSNHGIRILASDVDLDLSGFVLTGVAGSADGIEVQSGLTNVQIHNGTVRNWGGTGFDAHSVSRVTVNDIRVLNCGARGIDVGDQARVSNCLASSNITEGILIGSDSLVESSQTTDNGAFGILASSNSVVKACLATGNSKAGILATAASVVEDSLASRNGEEGILVYNRSSVQSSQAMHNGKSGFSGTVQNRFSDCVANHNQASGFAPGFRATITDCMASGNTSNGVEALLGCVIVDTTANENGRSGISCTVECRITRCNVYANTLYGIEVGNENVVEDCWIAKNGNDGVHAAQRLVLKNCVMMKNGDDGAEFSNFSVLTGNQSFRNSQILSTGAGLYTTGSSSHLAGNVLIENHSGLLLSASTTGNVYVGNRATGNSALDYNDNGSNRAGPTTLTSTPTNHPWANF